LFGLLKFQKYEAANREIRALRRTYRKGPTIAEMNLGVGGIAGGNMNESRVPQTLSSWGTYGTNVKVLPPDTAGLNRANSILLLADLNVYIRQDVSS